MNTREINARIAESVLKTAQTRRLNDRNFDFDRWYHYHLTTGKLKDYTAWEGFEPVLNWLKNAHSSIELGNSGELWWVNVPKWSEISNGQKVTHWGIVAIEETLPLAVCVAALRSVRLWSEELRSDS